MSVLCRRVSPLRSHGSSNKLRVNLENIPFQVQKGKYISPFIIMLGKHPTCAVHSSKREGQSSSLLSQMMAFVLEGQALFIIFPWLTDSQDRESHHHDKRIQVSRVRQYLLLERMMQLETAAETTLTLQFTSALTALGKNLCSQRFLERAIYPQLYLFEEGVHSVRIITLAICCLKPLAPLNAFTSISTLDQAAYSH